MMDGMIIFPHRAIIGKEACFGDLERRRLFPWLLNDARIAWCGTWKAAKTST